MATLGKAVIEFSANTATFISDVGRTAAMFDKSMAKMQAGINNIRNALVAAASLGGMGALIKSTIDAADQLGKLSQKVGISVEQLSALKFAAELADVGIDDLGKGLKEFNKSLVEATDKGSKTAGIFDALGVKRSGDPAEDLRRVADAFKQLTDAKLKSTAAAELFGKQIGPNLVPLLNEGREGIDRAAESARRLGLIIGPDLARQSGQFNDNLKVVTKQGEALGVTMTGKMLEGLVNITGNLVKAAEAGQLFRAALEEVNKVALANLSAVPGWIGFMADRGATGAFAKPPITGPVTGKIRRPDVMGPPAPAPNERALACTLSGGKWVGNRCVREGDKAAAQKALQDYIRTSEQIVRMDEEHAREVAEAWSFVPATLEAMKEREYWENMFPPEVTVNKTNAQIREYHKSLLEGIDSGEDYAVVTGQLAAGFDGMGNALKQNVTLAQDLGLTFASAFENAIVGGEKLRDVLKGLAQDVLRVFVRRQVTEPAAAFLTEAFKGIFGGAGGGGAEIDSASGGPIGANQMALVGEMGPELFMPSVAGSIVPNHALGGGGPTFNVDMRGADVAAVRRLERFVMRIDGTLEQRAVSATRADRNLTGDSR